MHILKVQENGQTFTAHIERDRWDSERVCASLFDVGSPVCVSVGDGACSFAALEDALWDALAERAHIRAAESTEAAKADLRALVAHARWSR